MRRALVVLLAFSTAGCLENDPRPPPGSVLVTASGDEAIVDGIVTEDGWSVSFERFLISLGHASAEDEEGTCNHTYSDPNYQRVMDMSVGNAQKVNLVYALGDCTLDLELSAPREDSVLGKGVTAADRDFMRTRATDDYATDAGVSFQAIGTATKAGVEKRFAWSYRRRIDYTTVGVAVDGNVTTALKLGENERLTWDFPVRGGALFQDRVDPAEAKLSFDAIASADDQHGNGDGEVTLAELAEVELTAVSSADRYADGPERKLTNLEAYIYNGLFPIVVEAHALEVEVLNNDRNPQ